MNFRLYESVDKVSLLSRNNTIEVYLHKFSDAFTDEGIKKIVINILKTNICIFSLNTANSLFDDIYDLIINDCSYDKIIETLTEKNVLFFSLFIHGINCGKKAYNLLKNINSCDEIYFNCSKDNLLDTLYLCEKINVPIVINGANISLEDYQKILDNYDFDKLRDKEIVVHYQEYGGDIDINTLYNTSCQINYITKKIKKYNLSPLERIMIVYDIAKNNFYQKEDRRENYLVSRTLDNVLKSNYIVCVGYVAIVNAMLKNLDINATPIICETKKDKHCRSMIYLNDSKYKVNGTYILDPTWDSKKNKDQDNVDKYNYFLLPIEIAEKTATTKILPILKLSLNDLIKLESTDDYLECDIQQKAEKNFEMQYYLKLMFLLVNNDNYDKFIENLCFYEFLSNEDKSSLKEIYEDVFKKYKIKDIDIDIFIRALYNVKKIEYYLSNDIVPKECSSRLEIPVVNNINILSIKNATTARYCSTKFFDSAKGGLYSFICYLGYEEYLNDYISSNIGKIVSLNTDNGIKRDMLNMQLLKVLKKEKSKKEIDNK